MQREELGAWLRLLLTPGLGPAGLRRLLAAFGTPEAVFGQSAAALATVAGPARAQSLLAQPADWAAQCDTTWRWLQQPGHHLLPWGDAAYPPELLQTDDPPPLLYLCGDLSALAHPFKLAVVGSRNPTPQGLENAQWFSRSLAEAGACIVSGLALGVDAAAHEGALAAGAPTLAVVGTGLDRVYPGRHLDLARRIERQGALISELPLGSPPLAPHFPRRNRLIAALGQGTLVVEATVQSGSLITARLAADLGREVCAIPGSIHAPQSRGCHALIRQGAKLVESAQDVLEELRPATRVSAAAPQVTPAEPDTSISPLLEALGFDPLGLDALQARTGLPIDMLQARLLELELEGRVGRLPGGLFQRIARA